MENRGAIIICQRPNPLFTHHLPLFTLEKRHSINLPIPLPIILSIKEYHGYPSP